MALREQFGGPITMWDLGRGREGVVEGSKMGVFGGFLGGVRGLPSGFFGGVRPRPKV